MPNASMIRSLILISLLLFIVGCGTTNKLTEDNQADYNISDIKYTLKVNTVGMGSVEISPLAANGLYNPGTTVTLTPIPDYGWAFFGLWEGDVSENTVILDESQEVTVNFSHLT